MKKLFCDKCNAELKENVPETKIASLKIHLCNNCIEKVKKFATTKDPTTKKSNGLFDIGSDVEEEFGI